MPETPRPDPNPEPSTLERHEAKGDPNNENLDEDLQRELYNLVKQYEDEDSWIRKQQIKLWKKNEEFW